jgi:hypothetical protein
MLTDVQTETQHLLDMSLKSAACFSPEARGNVFIVCNVSFIVYVAFVLCVLSVV